MAAWAKNEALKQEAKRGRKARRGYSTAFCQAEKGTSANRVAGGISPPAPTPPGMRVPDVPGFTEIIGSRIEAGVVNVNPPSFDRQKPLILESRLYRDHPRSRRHRSG